MSESEFWTSTPAKVFALCDRQEEIDKRRDFFPALLISMELSSKDNKVTPEEVLSWRYRDRSKSVLNTPVEFDDVFGASTDWK